MEISKLITISNRITVVICRIKFELLREGLLKKYILFHILFLSENNET